MLTNRFILNEDETLHEINSDIPLELEEIIKKAERINVRNRYQSADEVIRDLRKVDYGLRGFQVLGDGLLGPSYLSPERTVVKVINGKVSDVLNDALRPLEFIGLEAPNISSHPNISGYMKSHPLIEEAHVQREYVNGTNLEESIRERGKFKGEETARIMRDVLNGLVFVEKDDIVHGNVKPSNIIIGNDGKAKVVDFLPTVLVQEAAKNGSLREQERQYFHPAVLSGEEPTHKTDLYSMGAIAFRMISGEPYRPGKSLNLTAKGDKELEGLITDALML